MRKKNSKLMKFHQGETLVMSDIVIACSFHTQVIIYHIRGGKQASNTRPGLAEQKQPDYLFNPRAELRL